MAPTRVETGHLVSSNSPQSLAKGIESFVPVSSELSGEAIRESVLGFGWENVTSALVNEYETVLRQQ